MRLLSRQVTQRRIKVALDKLPEKLGDAYNEIWDRIFGQDKDKDDQDEDIQTIARAALTWITYAKERLTVEMLLHAIASWLDPELKRIEAEDLIELELLLSSCVGLLILNQEDGVIRLVHYTTQDYLERQLPRIEANTSIARICLTQLEGLRPIAETENMPIPPPIRVPGISLPWGWDSPTTSDGAPPSFPPPPPASAAATAAPIPLLHLHPHLHPPVGPQFLPRPFAPPPPPAAVPIPPLHFPPPVGPQFPPLPFVPVHHLHRNTGETLVGYAAAYWGDHACEGREEVLEKLILSTLGTQEMRDRIDARGFAYRFRLFPSRFYENARPSLVHLVSRNGLPGICSRLLKNGKLFTSSQILSNAIGLKKTWVTSLEQMRQVVRH